MKDSESNKGRRCERKTKDKMGEFKRSGESVLKSDSNTTRYWHGELQSISSFRILEAQNVIVPKQYARYVTGAEAATHLQL